MLAPPRQYYPAGYWASLIARARETDFLEPPRGNGIPPEMKTQGQFLAWLKTAVVYLPSAWYKATAEILRKLGTVCQHEGRLASPHRVRAGGDRHGPGDPVFSATQRAISMFAGWTDRIAAGEVPPPPPRPRDSSATSSSRSGIGRRKDVPATTRSQQTGATDGQCVRFAVRITELSTERLPVSIQYTRRHPHHTPAAGPENSPGAGKG